MAVRHSISFNRPLRFAIVAALAATVIASGSSQAAPLLKGSRVLGVQVNEAEDRDYFRAFAAAKTLGMEAVSLSANWDDVETSERMFAPKPNYFAIANSFYPSRVKLDLFVRALDTNGYHLPRDLRGRPIDDPLVIDRYTKCVDWVLSQLANTELTFLGVGNEIDIGLGKDSSGYERFARFLAAVRSRLRAKYPALAVGASATLDGLVGAQKAVLRQVNREADLVIVTYYPLETGVGVRDPSTVVGDIHRLVDTYPAVPIIFSEAGYPSSAALKSSEQRQAEFVREVFKAWDAHPAQIRQITFYHLTDSGPDTVAEFTRYYGLSAGPFKAFLSSLGLRTFPGSGTDKEAFRTLREEAKSRGW